MYDCSRLKPRAKLITTRLPIANRGYTATGITNFLENDGTLEAAQRIAGHADSRTTKLYDRCGQKDCSKTFGKVQSKLKRPSMTNRPDADITRRKGLL